MVVSHSVGRGFIGVTLHGLPGMTARWSAGTAYHGMIPVFDKDAEIDILVLELRKVRHGELEISILLNLWLPTIPYAPPSRPLHPSCQIPFCSGYPLCSGRFLPPAPHGAS